MAHRFPKPGLDFATLRPDLAAESVCPIAPTIHALMSNRKNLWRCNACLYEWGATFNDRANGHGCPYCARRVIIAGRNDFATLRPDLAAESIDPIAPTVHALMSNKNNLWRCGVCSYEWSATFSNRAKVTGTGCPHCAGRVVVTGRNDFATLRPDLAAESVCPIAPTIHALKSEKKNLWRCRTCSHEWGAGFCDRANGRGCPLCAGRVVVTGKNDFATLRPDLAAESVCPIAPTIHALMSNRKNLWRCNACLHEWGAAFYSRASGTGCPECATSPGSSLTLSMFIPSDKQFVYSFEPKGMKGRRKIGEGLPDRCVGEHIADCDEIPARSKGYGKVMEALLQLPYVDCCSEPPPPGTFGRKGGETEVFRIERDRTLRSMEDLAWLIDMLPEVPDPESFERYRLLTSTVTARLRANSRELYQ